jgi:hypothetical protein
VIRAVALASLLAACAGGAAQRGSSGQAILVITSNVPDAQVYLDGRFIAPLDALAGGIAVEAGTHRLELRHEDYFSTYREVQVARAARQRLAVDMAAVLP